MVFRIKGKIYELKFLVSFWKLTELFILFYKNDVCFLNVLQECMIFVFGFGTISSHKIFIDCISYQYTINIQMWLQFMERFLI